MKDKLTIKQQNFARFIFEGHTQREAWGLAGYSTRYQLAWVDSHACRLAHRDKIKIRIDELNAKADDVAVAPVLERKKVLSQIVRADLTDYLKDDSPVVNKQSPNRAALAEYSVKERKFGQDRAIKLRDPIAAIAELNKMDGAYPREEIDLNVNINVISRIPRPAIETKAIGIV